MEQLNGAPPGLRGYYGAQAADEQSQAHEMRGMQTLMQLKQQMDAQNSQLQVKQILANSPDMQSAIPQLMKAGPAGLQAASSLAALNEHVTKGRVAADKAAFYSPENQQKYMDPGQTIQPATPVDDNGVPNVAAQGLGSMNMDKFLKDAAARGVINPETYANHLAQQEQKRATLQQTGDLRRETLTQQAELRREQLSQQAELARQRAEDQKLSQADRNQARMEMIRLTASLRQGADATKAADKATAAGEKKVQQLSTVFEKAKIGESHAVLKGAEDALAARPDAAEYISGPKSMIPSMAVEKFVEGGKEINAAKQSIEKLFNIELKNRSGAAVTLQEFERLKAEYGKGAFKTAAQLQNAMKQARTILEGHARSVAAGFPPEALDAYNANLEAIGGSRVIQPTASAPKAPVATPGASGKWGITRE